MMRGLYDRTSSLLELMLDRSARRHTVLSSNIANADTPGYLPVDLRFDDVLGKTLEAERSDPNHLGKTRRQGEVVYDVNTVPGLDGNAVDLDREMAKLAANSQRYATASQTTSKRLAMLKYVIEADK